MWEKALLPSCAVVIMLWSLTVQAATCPNCPAGCVPRDYVEELKDPAAPPTRDCTTACVPLEDVKTLKAKPSCEMPETTVTQVQPPVVEQAAPERQNAKTTQNRVIFLPTALSPPSGEKIFTGYGAGLWDGEYVLNENLQLGGYLVVPVYIGGFFPSVKGQFALSDNLSLGFGGIVGIVGPYAGESSGGFLFVALGHGELTIHNESHLFNIGFAAVTAGVRASGEDLDMMDGAILLPNIGYRYAFHRNWSFQFEFTLPLVVSDGEVLNQEEVPILLTYGFRGHGDSMFGDVGFVFIIWDEYIDNVWKYTPLGIPYFSIGFNF